MGLDMYLRGSHYNSEHSHKGDIKRPMLENKYNISEYNVEFAYWRKHPDLHGYIVKEFAKGVDSCQDIELNESDIDKIIMAIRDDKLLKDPFFHFLKKDPMFIQALKDFKTMGFIEIKENGIEIIDRKGLENYLNNFGKFESDTKH